MSEDIKNEASEPTGESSRNVMVEIRVPKHQSPAQTLTFARQLQSAGFQPDMAFEPVPAGEPADPAQAAELEAAGEITVLVRGSIHAGDIGTLEAREGVVAVWPDTPIAPFGMP